MSQLTPERLQEIELFRKHGHEVVEWMVEFWRGIGSYPVKPDVRPGDIKKQLPLDAPLKAETWEKMFEDFKSIILPGMTHWQHPRFFAYFPTGASEPSLLGEMLSLAIGAQTMVWYTSPAAEELEERVMEWLRNSIGLPKTFTGVLQDTSSVSILVSLLTAREAKSKYNINKKGFTGNERYRIYSSSQAHSVVDKAARIIGVGHDNLVKISVDESFAMIPEALEKAIEEDVRKGYVPLAIVSTLGTTSSTALDPLPAINKIAKKYDAWHAVDGSYAGSALILPEYRWMGAGLEDVDAFVFNPHKWFFVHSDCSAYFVKDKRALTETFSILPEYLKTPEDHLVNNYRDWGIQLGRKFRALKVWFVMRHYGLEGLQKRLRSHIEWGQWAKREIEKQEDFEILAPVPLNLVCFRYRPKGASEGEVERLNVELLKKINDSGLLLLTQTKLNNKYCIRFVGGNINTDFEDVKKAWEFVLSTARKSLTSKL